MRIYDRMRSLPASCRQWYRRPVLYRDRNLSDVGTAMSSFMQIRPKIKFSFLHYNLYFSNTFQTTGRRPVVRRTIIKLFPENGLFFNEIRFQGNFQRKLALWETIQLKLSL